MKGLDEKIIILDEKTKGFELMKGLDEKMKELDEIK